MNWYITGGIIVAIICIARAYWYYVVKPIDDEMDDYDETLGI